MERFWSKVLVKGDDDCWEWQSRSISHGYGIVRVGGRKGHAIGAHRMSWILKHGSIPDGMHVLHKCDNRKCVNPNHLFIGTNLDNIQDKLNKGRQCKGESHPMWGKGYLRLGKNHPMYGKPGAWLGKKGIDHPAYGRNGNANGIAIYTEQDVREIRDLAKHKIFSQPELAQLYGGSRSGINNIVNYYAWKHIP